ncbi:MAG: alpha-amylase family glycosyl hydrolase, partial [Actinomycetota bacterium]
MVPDVLNDVTLYHNRGDSTWTGESVTFGDFVGLDDLMTEDPLVVDTMTDIYTAWMDMGIDGFRIDTVKHVNFEFWEVFTAAIADHALTTPVTDEFFTFGEVYDADATKLAPYVRDTDMTSVLDFTFQSVAVNYAKGQSAQGPAALFAADDHYTTDHSSSSALPTFLGNHDMGRVGYLLQGAGDELARSEFAHAFMYLTRGQPVVYYGDEQGFVGLGGDKSARQSMFPSLTEEYQDQPLLDGSIFGTGDHFDPGGLLYDHIAGLATLRDAHEALDTGAQVELFAADGGGVYAFARIDRDEKVEYVVAANNQTTVGEVSFATLTPGATYAPLYGTATGVTASAEGEVTITVPALSAVVLRADRTVADAGGEQALTLTPVAGAKLEGMVPVTADVADDRWAETSFSWRVVGETDYHPLGTAEDDTPRVFHDLVGLPAGTPVEYRAVTVDVDGTRSAASSFGVVGVDLSGVVPETDPGELFVTVPGSHNSEMGCAGDWDPACEAAQLTLDADSGMYTRTFDLPAGDYEYKVAIGGTWDENYGAGGVPNGANIAYSHAGGSVTFWYDPVTHYASSTAEGPIVTLPGSFNEEIGCPDDWMPACMVTWMQDLDLDGILTFATDLIPTGSWEVKVAHDRSWDENYGEGGELGGANITFSTTSGKMVTFTYDPVTHLLTIEVEDPPVAGTGQFLGHWIDETTIAWPAGLVSDAAATTWTLYAAPAGGMEFVDGSVTGGAALGELTWNAAGLTPEQLENRGHLAGFLALTLQGVDRAAIEEALTGQLLVLQESPDGLAEVFTGVQIPGVLDDLYAAGARTRELGVAFDDGVPNLTLWAPTAKDVDLHLFEDGIASAATVLPMGRQVDGTWTITGEEGWKDLAHLYDVEVYAPTTGQVEDNLVTDPYSVGLTLDSKHSVIVDLDSEDWMPELWLDAPGPEIEQFADRTIYELHIRDFSATDETVPEDLRGTYAAFALDGTNGTAHLRELAEAGMNTLHLLPSFDIATIPEDRGDQLVPDIPADAAPDSEEQQAAVTAVADQDAFNWGYDPFHFNVPEGSYASEGNQDGGDRVAEFRLMVGGIHDHVVAEVVDPSHHEA